MLDKTDAVIFLAIGGLGTLLAAGILSWPTTIRGDAAIVDGDTIRIGGQSIRLLGIDAPEISQPCTPHAITTEVAKPFDCGRRARQELSDYIDARPVVCETSSLDVYRRHLAFCSVEGVDLSSVMVRRGWAIAAGDYAYKYASEERMAKAERLGIWNTKFDHPSIWRRK